MKNNLMPDLFDKVLLLKKSDIFNEINTEDLRFVADALEEEQYFSGDRIFEKNDRGEYMYLIIEGQVGIALEKNLDEFVATLSSGECFGEMNLLDDLPRSASAVVMKDVRLLKLSRARLRGLIMSYPELGMGMLKSLSLRLRETTRLVSKK
ncbi:MAG: cyclic nucleotide-binding domain-containing protein [Gammaproteobacteria bacterium]|nr:cyclic nucleotide-binding domain-containing protein [Gammaproteobacteria bacterium]